MLTNVSRLKRNVAYAVVALSLQAGFAINASADEKNPFPESSTAYTKLQELRQRASDRKSVV